MRMINDIGFGYEKEKGKLHLYAIAKRSRSPTFSAKTSSFYKHLGSFFRVYGYILGVMDNFYYSC